MLIQVLQVVCYNVMYFHHQNRYLLQFLSFFISRKQFNEFIIRFTTFIVAQMLVNRLLIFIVLLVFIKPQPLFELSILLQILIQLLKVRLIFQHFLFRQLKKLQQQLLPLVLLFHLFLLLLLLLIDIFYQIRPFSLFQQDLIEPFLLPLLFLL